MSEQLGPSDLNHLVDAMKRAADGDYAVQVDEIKGNEDYNQLARAVNNLITKTRDTLTTKLSVAKALNKSEAKYHRLHDSMKDAFACTDMEGRIIESNPSYQALLGYTAEELSQLNYFDLTPEKWHEFERATATEQLLSRGYSDVYEKEYRRKDGTIIPVEIRVFLLRSEDGQPEAMWGIIRDISESKQAENKLLEYEFFLHKSQEIAHIGSYSFDLLNDQFQCSPELDRIFGIQPDHPKTKAGWLLVVHPDDRDSLEHDFEDSIKNKTRFDKTYRVIRQTDMNERWIHGLGELEHDENGAPIKMTGTVQDITESKQAEDALRNSEYYLRKSQEVAQIGSYHFNITDDYWTCSQEMNRILGISPDVHKTLQTWVDLIHPDDQDMMTQYLTNIMARKFKFDKEYRIIRQTDNETCWMYGVGEFEYDQNGAPISMFGTIQDITERKNAEKEQEKLSLQLRQSQKLESVGRLAGGVAHDFNNMLNVILGYAELIEGQLDENNPIRSDIREISRAGCRARDITKQLLAFSRKQMISPKLINANQCIQTSIKSLVHLIGEHIEMNFYPKKGLWSIKFDPSQLDQLLINLSVNARDAMPKGGKLTIETDNVSIDEEYCRQHVYFSPGQYILIGVSDSGTGIDKDVLSKIFEPFFTTKGVGEGTGLGLATVYGIIKQNNGFINVYSEPGQGTTFKMYLPHAAEAVDERKPLKIEEEDSGRETILMVEDNDLVRKMTQKMLESAGYIVIVANDPANAIEICSEPDIAIDLMISDVVMPQMNGTDLWEKVKIIRPDMKVLFMSGYTSNVIVHHGVLDESVLFIQKPFTRNDLIKSINSALGKEEPV
ncbi:MAG: PAS domain S-box protein [Candidatus Hinthialibacter antarcticus]|nr:PAS domain S-box protein [Candidatus Hinthialibacter antarcticus]